MDPKLKRGALGEAIAAALDAADGETTWGLDDCALWCAGPVVKVLGYDPAASFRGRYRTALGANRVLGPDGLLGAIQTAARKHRWRQIKPTEADTGDIAVAIMPTPKGRPAQTCLICRAPGWFVARSDNGFTALASDNPQISRVWSIL